MRWTRRRSSEPDLIPKFFELGLMGIEVPEQYGGAGGAIFMAVLAIEELARVDASAAIYVDVQNTLVNNALLRWGNDEQKERLLPAAHHRPAGRLRALRAGSGSDAFALETRARAGRATTGCSPAASSGSPTAPRPASSSSSPTPIPSKGYKGITAFLVEREFAGLLASARRRTSSASAPPAPPS